MAEKTISVIVMNPISMVTNSMAIGSMEITNGRKTRIMVPHIEKIMVTIKVDMEEIIHVVVI